MTIATNDRDQIDMLFRRIRRLERANKCQRIAGSMILVVLLAFACAAAIQNTESFEASKYVLVDSTGQEQGVWAAGDDGPELVMRDRRGNVRIVVAAMYDRPNVALYDSVELKQIELVSRPGDFPVGGSELRIFGFPSVAYGATESVLNVLGAEARLSADERGAAISLSGPDGMIIMTAVGVPSIGGISNGEVFDIR